MTINFFTKRTVLMLCAVMLLDMSCSNNESGEKVDCDDSDLSIDLTSSNPTTCSSADGEIEVEASGGKSPYEYSINGGAFDDNFTFDDLGSGTYTLAVLDANDCMREVELTLNSPGSTVEVGITSAEDAGCKTATGSITAEAEGGVGPYEYKLNNGAFGATTEFTNLAPGTYTVTAKDANGCVSTSGPEKILSGVSYENDIKPLIANRCAHCHGPGGIKSDRDWTVYTNVKNFASGIKTRTGNGSMPQDLAASGGLPQAERDLIACWVDDGALNN